MNKANFEKLINDTVSDDIFNIINNVSLHFTHLFNCDSEIVYFYMTHGVDGFIKLNSELTHIEKVTCLLEETKNKCNFYKELYHISTELNNVLEGGVLNGK